MKDEYDGGEYEMKVGVSVSHLTCRLGKKRAREDSKIQILANMSVTLLGLT